jgi:tetratricopeptide (TPR) repeat protein
MAKKKKSDASGFETIESTLTGTEQFIERYQTQLTIGFIVLVAVVSLYIAYNKWYKAPLEKEALEQAYVAEQYFAADSFYLAINGDGQFPGFIDIVDEYSFTDVGNMARLYLGISYIKTENYTEAINHLVKFDSDDPILEPLAQGNIGDAYSALEQFDKAAQYYQKAGEKDKNKLTAPIYYMKAARAFEQTGNYEKALDIYKIIKSDYRDTEEGREIEKYIARAENKLK